VKIAVVDYGAGNIRSAVRAFEHVAGQVGIAAKVEVVTTPEAILAADRIVLPGDGAFADCIGALRSRTAMEAALEEAVRKRGRPFFGICVGMQLLATRGLEYGEHAGLGWIAGDVERITPSDPRLKVPHMGWNELRLNRPHPVTAGLPAGAHAYFIHSYHLVPKAHDAVLAEADHGGPIVAVVAQDNVFGTQFHPEKSQATGLKMIANFLQWAP
jgi:glutamine amidotransferase